MAQSNAIIATKTEGSLFLVETQCGLLYDYNNIEQLFNCLKKLITNIKLRKKMQVYNKKKAKDFIWEEIAKKLERYYK